MVWRLEYIDGNHHWRWKVSFGFFSSFPVFLWVSGALHIWAFIDECVEQHEAEQGNQKRNNWQVDFCIDPKWKKGEKKLPLRWNQSPIWRALIKRSRRFALMKQPPESLLIMGWTRWINSDAAAGTDSFSFLLKIPLYFRRVGRGDWVGAGGGCKLCWLCLFRVCQCCFFEEAYIINETSNWSLWWRLWWITR